jgi:hypothetical protein
MASAHHGHSEGAFNLYERTIIAGAKQRYREIQADKARRALCPTPLLPAPKIAGLLPAPGHTSSPYTNPRDRLMIGGKVYAVGEGYVMAEIEDAIAAQRKALKLGLFQRAHELVEQTAAFSYHGSVPTRNGRRGTILRRLTDGRYVVKIDCPLLYWEFYTQDELRALVNVSAGVKAAA